MAQVMATSPRFNPWVVAMTVTLATFMEVLDTSIANVALPHIAGNLGATADDDDVVRSAGASCHIGAVGTSLRDGDLVPMHRS